MSTDGEPHELIPEPAGARLPPGPPVRTAIGLEGDDERGPVTISREATGQGTFFRPEGYGQVILRILPNRKGKGVEIQSQIEGGALPEKFLQAASVGIRAVLQSGAKLGVPAIDGRPVVDVIVHVIDASFKEPESTRVAFKEAAILAFTDAMKTAGPIDLQDSHS